MNYRSISTYHELIASVALVVLVALFLDPFMLWMPQSVVYVLVVVMVATFLALAVLIWGEKAFDERDEFHRRIAGRIGYLLGSTVIIVGIVWQTIFSHPDPWLVFALIALLVGKIAGLYYARRKY